LQNVASGSLDGALTVLSRALAEFLSPNGLVAYFAALYWLNDKYKCAYGVWLIPLSVLLNGHIKWAVRAGRPCWIDARLVLKDWSDEYSFPSGHSQIAWALVTFFAEANKCQLSHWSSSNGFMYCFATVVSLSRVYMGVHYPRDVLAGALVGILLAKVFLRVLPWMKEAGRWSKLKRLCAIQVVAGLAWKAISNHNRVVRSRPDLDLRWWELHSAKLIDPVAVPFAGYIGQVGVLSGLGFGVPFLKEVALPPAPTTSLRRALRLLVGYSGLLTIYFSIRLLEHRVFPPGRLQMFARFARFASVAPTVFLLMPWIFAKLKL